MGYRFRKPLKICEEICEVLGFKLQFAVTKDILGGSLLYACLTKYRTSLGDNQQWYSC